MTREQIAVTGTKKLKARLALVVSLVGTDEEYLVEDEYELILDELDRRWQDEQH